MAYEYPLTEVQSRVFSFGLAGIIIGSPWYGDGQIYAYDLGCPQCDLPSARLTVNTTPYAKCAKCGASYELNNHGYATNGGHPLYRYPISLNGNMLMVHN
jgi:nitrite reductase/ring-hydroxylating ferredoxin subunit